MFWWRARHALLCIFRYTKASILLPSHGMLPMPNLKMLCQNAAPPTFQLFKQTFFGVVQKLICEKCWSQPDLLLLSNNVVEGTETNLTWKVVHCSCVANSRFHVFSSFGKFSPLMQFSSESCIFIQTTACQLRAASNNYPLPRRKFRCGFNPRSRCCPHSVVVGLQWSASFCLWKLLKKLLATSTLGRAKLL